MRLSGLRVRLRYVATMAASVLPLGPALDFDEPHRREEMLSSLAAE